MLDCDDWQLTMPRTRLFTLIERNTYFRGSLMAQEQGACVEILFPLHDHDDERGIGTDSRWSIFDEYSHGGINQKFTSYYSTAQ